MTFSKSCVHMIAALLIYFNWLAVPVFCFLSLVFFLFSKQWRWLALNSVNALLFPVGMVICFFCIYIFRSYSMIVILLHLAVGAVFMVCPSLTLVDAWDNHNKCLFAAALTAIGFYVSGMLLMIGVLLILPFV